MSTINCPCGSVITYEKCCGAIHLGKKKAISAEALIRSRYTAFTMADGDYLMKSHHSNTRPTSQKKEIVNWAKSVSWVKLDVLYTTMGMPNDLEGTVEFKAYFMENGKMEVIHENSLFKRENDKWVYLGLAE